MWDAGTSQGAIGARRLGQIWRRDAATSRGTEAAVGELFVMSPGVREVARPSPAVKQRL